MKPKEGDREGKEEAESIDKNQNREKRRRAYGTIRFGYKYNYNKRLEDGFYSLNGDNIND